MKKQILLGAAFLFATATIFAQAACFDCSVSQMSTGFIGAGMDANVNKGTQFGSNTGNVLQLGDRNKSVVFQDGKMGTANYGYGNNASVKQDGYRNESDIKQSGDDNTGIVRQFGTMNYAKQDVGVGYAEDNWAKAKQRGYNNKSFQTQRYDNNWAKVKQEGNGWGGQNLAIQDQRTMKDGENGSDAEIYQTGYMNKAEQIQRGSNNDAYSRQRGANNESVEEQTADHSGSVNESDINQFSWALGNTACVKQDASDTFSNTSVINQTYNNTASVMQSANAGNNHSLINQTGSNSFKVEQVNGVSMF